MKFFDQIIYIFSFLAALEVLHAESNPLTMKVSWRRWWLFEIFKKVCGEKKNASRVIKLCFISWQDALYIVRLPNFDEVVSRAHKGKVVIGASVLGFILGLSLCSRSVQDSQVGQGHGQHSLLQRSKVSDLQASTGPSSMPSKPENWPSMSVKVKVLRVSLFLISRSRVSSKMSRPVVGLWI